MKKKSPKNLFQVIATLLFCIMFSVSWGQSIFTNSITDSNPSASNPYTSGQVVNANITASGIGRGSGIGANAGSGRYNANSWNTSSLDATAYFQFTITPNAGYKINFVSFVYTGQASGTGPSSFAVRSSLDGYTANIGSPSASGTTISLSAAAYQNITTAITFRFYGWGASGASGTYSINDFTFNGTVVPAASAPAVTTTQVLTTNITTNSAISGGNVTNVGGASTTRGVVWNTSSNPTIALSTKTNNGTSTSTGAFTSNITGLLSNTLYYYRAYATNSAGTSYGTQYSFYTHSVTPGAPLVTNATFNSLDVTLDTNGNNAATQYAIRINGTNFINASGNISATEVWQTAAAWSTVTINGLDEETTYSFDVKARNSANVETAYSAAAEGTTISAAAPFFTLDESSLNFDTVCINNTSDGYLIFSGENFSTNATINVGAQTGFSYSLTEGTGYTNTLSVTNYNGGQVTVWVRFSPTVVQVYDNTINLSGTGADAEATLDVIVTGEGINTPATVTTGGSSGITVTTATLAGDAAEGGCTAITAYGIEYSITNNFVPGAGTQEASSNISGTGYTVSLSGLMAGTTYYYRAYVTDGSGITYGNQASFTTSGLDAPVTTPATTITSNSFIANWTAVEGAEGYYLDVSEDENFSQGSYAPDLFISEYVEGDSFNKYIEIYNGTGAAVNLSSYQLSLYSNGAASPSQSMTLSGTLASGGTMVYKHGSATGYSGPATVNSSVMNFNGNDPIGLFKNSTLIDVVGTVGSSANFAADRTLIRKQTVEGPSSTYNANEWTNVSYNYSNLGSHTYDGGLQPYFVTGYNGLDVGNVTSYEVTGLNEFTTYYYRVRAYSTNSTSVNSNTTAVTTKPASIVWNGTQWTPSQYPDTTPVVIDTTIDAFIEGDYNTATDGSFEVKTLTVNSGLVVVAEGTSITVADEIVNNNGAENFIVENNANVIQLNEATNVGEITVQKLSSPLYRLDYTLWSSPVRGQNLQGFSPETLANRFYDYNEATDLFGAIDPEMNDFEEGLGYLIRMPNDHPAFVDSGTPGTAWMGTFVGVPYNGTVTVPMETAFNGYNLVGNPYPSPINIHDFYEANTGILNGSSALYFWRKRNDPDATTYATVTMAAYTANNQTGGWGDTGSGTFVGDPSDWVINPGQGFFVQASGGVLTFNNTMRADVNNGQFFRMSPQDNELDISRWWLNLTGNSGEFSQMAVAYSDVTTDGLDYGWDGKALTNDGLVKVYSTLQENRLAIQARASFADTDAVTLGYSVTEAGSYTLSLDHTDGLFLEGQDIFLTDNLTGETVNLRDIDYMFTSEAGVFEDRFMVTYNFAPLSNPELELNNNNVMVFSKDEVITVTSGNLEMADVTIYDVRGRLLFTQSGINASQLVINTLQSQQQMLIVKVTTDKGTVSKKIVF
ncbi:T9SS sorting signal type C domain-containing protein [Flavobacterium sp. LaA7.5]|nr:T9SS sorting signal type C domain-containing protein [Flavobacterium salilacus subsp. altitudinum]